VSGGSVVISDSLVINSLQYAVTNSNKFPTKFDGKVENPNKISNIKQASDDQYIHFSIDAKFESVVKVPSQVYVSLKKEGGVQINSYGKYNANSKLFEVTFDVSKDIEVHLNGEYQIIVNAADYRAKNAASWNVGKAKLWYKEGHEEGNNKGIKPEFETLPTIDFVYPPEQPQINLLVSSYLFNLFSSPLLVQVSSASSSSDSSDSYSPTVPISQDSTSQVSSSW